MAAIFIFHPQSSKRISYTLSFVFREKLGVPFTFTSDEQAFQNCGVFRLYYGNDAQIACDARIPDCGLLRQTGIYRSWRDHFLQKCVHPLFPSKDRHVASFDLFSAIFYLISRYEEYHDDPVDRHGRFLPISSILHDLGYLMKPMVDIWITELVKAIQSKCNLIVADQPAYSFLSTVDIDLPWHVRHKKGIFRLISAGRHLSAIRSWYRIASGKEKDPWDTLEQIHQWHQKIGAKVTAFFHVGPLTRWDRSASYKRKPYEKMIRNTAEWAKDGYSSVLLQPESPVQDQE